MAKRRAGWLCIIGAVLYFIRVSLDDVTTPGPYQGCTGEGPVTSPHVITWGGEERAW